MKYYRSVTCGVLATWAAQVTAQSPGWIEHQVNTSICTWSQPRAALIRDTVYLDGGQIFWSPGLDDETIGSPEAGGFYKGLIYKYNLTEPFSRGTNVTGILLKDPKSKAPGGEGSNEPYYVDGGMLANDAQFFLYGGLVAKNSLAYKDPDADEVEGYQAYPSGSEKPDWQPTFEDATLPDGVTRYIAYGAAVNAPSENKAWYFSGMTSSTRGPMYIVNTDDTVPTNASNTLISVEMDDELRESWTNTTLHSDTDAKPRANAEAVWVPVGEQGIIVVLGGVTYPHWVDPVGGESEDEEASKKESPEFMRDIDVYDVANKKWYKQETEKGPGTRTRGCAVLARPADNSSFNIYYYGGYDGLHPKDDFSDEVWVLSLPSFTWTMINEGKSDHARAGHKCFSPYPDQMMVFGGYVPTAGATSDCLMDGPVLNFNLTSGEWLDSYDPAEYGDYGVPDKVQSVIGGDASGGATATEPSSGWDTKGLGEVFSTAYDMDKITTYYPYARATETGRPNAPDDPDDDNGGGGGLPGWVAPVLGVVLGLMLVTGIVVLFCLWRRRKIFKNHPSEQGTEDARMRIRSWAVGLRNHPPEKPETVTSSEETPASPEMDESRVVIGSTPSAVEPYITPYEMEDTARVELDDTSPPVELHDTGLSPIDVIQKHSHLSQRKQRSLSDPSYSDFGGGGDYNSTVSRSSAAVNSNRAHSERVDSPLPAPSPEPQYDDRVTSGVSSVTERGAAHLRQISETTVSSTGMHPVNVERPTAERTISENTEPLNTPVSPPTAMESPGEDYLSARGVVSPMRRSMFHENEEDMSGGKDR